MISVVLHGAALFLIANLIAGLVRVYRGPTAADRLLTLLLFGTTTVATVLLLAYAQEVPALVEVALIFVMLAAIAAIAFIRIPRNHRSGDGDQEE